MNLKNFQVQVDRWHVANFPQEADASFFVLAEEVGELARAVVKGRQGIRGGSARWEAEKATEAADVLISLIAFCNQNNINLAHAVTERWKKVGARVSASAEEQSR